MGADRRRCHRQRMDCGGDSRSARPSHRMRVELRPRARDGFRQGSRHSPRSTIRSTKCSRANRWTPFTYRPRTKSTLGQCIAAAAAGAHVLCDKPLALRLADAREMVESCRAAGVTLAVNHHLRADSAHEKMRELVAAGAIGKPLAARVFHTGHLPPHLRGWRLDSPAKGGGAILDLTVHNADAVAFSLGEYPRASSPSTSAPGSRARAWRTAA